jgi:hypothetical protein
VQLELVGDSRNTAMTFQEWGQVLNRAGIQNVHIRAATEKDKIGIEIQARRQVRYMSSQVNRFA